MLVILGALLGFLLGQAHAECVGHRREEERRYGVPRYASSFEQQLREEMEREDRTSVRALFGRSIRASDARAPPTAPNFLEPLLLLASLFRRWRRGRQHGRKESR